MSGTAVPAGGRPLDHVGVAVADLEAATARWTALGAETEGHAETLAEHGVRVQFLRLGPSRLELLAPLGVEGPVARFLDRHRGGLHHLALRVPDLEAELARLGAEGAELLDARPRRGHGGRRVAFVHPAWSGGTLVELVEARAEDGGR